MVYSTDRSKAVVPVLVLLFVALWFILRGDLLYVFPCVILFLYFLVLLVLRLPRLGKRELILVFFVRLFDLCLFGFVGFLFLLGSGKGCVLWLWHSLDFSLTFFYCLQNLYSKELLENLNAQSLHSVNSIKSFDFSTLYTTIPHVKLKSKLKAIINQCFFHKNGNRRFQYVVIGYKDTYFVRDHSDAPQKYSDADVIKMLEYLIDIIFVEFGGRIFQQTIGIPMGTNCAPTCFYTRMRRSLYKVSSKQARNTSHNNSISPTDI